LDTQGQLRRQDGLCQGPQRAASSALRRSSATFSNPFLRIASLAGLIGPGAVRSVYPRASAGLTAFGFREEASNDPKLT
jgi:hypothetical protein